MWDKQAEAIPHVICSSRFINTGLYFYVPKTCNSEAFVIVGFHTNATSLTIIVHPKSLKLQNIYRFVFTIPKKQENQWKYTIQIRKSLMTCLSLTGCVQTCVCLCVRVLTSYERRVCMDKSPAHLSV